MSNCVDCLVRMLLPDRRGPYTSECIRLQTCVQVYMFLGPTDVGRLEETVRAEVAANPPLGYEPEEAAAAMLGAAQAQLTASREREVRAGGCGGY
jgi:hypothetical protein